MRAPELRLFPGENSGRFRPGERPSPATEIKPGERRSPATEFRAGQRHGAATEFKKGQLAPNKLPIGSETIRTVKRTGKQRAWVKVAEPNVWKKRAIVVWEAHSGPLPKGMLIHHRDGNSINDAPENLVALTRTEHVAEHQLELAEASLAAAKKARLAK